MKLGDLKQRITDIEQAFGPSALELDVCVQVPHEYWGSVDDIVNSITISETCKPEGPKKPARRAVIIE